MIPKLNTPDFTVIYHLNLELHDAHHIILGGVFNFIIYMNLDSNNYLNLNNKKQDGKL